MLFPFTYYFQSLPEGHCIQPIIDTRRSQPIVHHCQPVIVNQSNSHHCQKVIVYSRQLMQSMQLIPLLDDAMPVQLSGNNLQGFRGSADNPQIQIQGSMHSMPQEPILDSMPLLLVESSAGSPCCRSLTHPDGNAGTRSGKGMESYSPTIS